MGYATHLALVGSSPVAARKVSPARQARGRLACLAGALAEDAVEHHLLARGWAVLKRRWRGKAGEIDLICQDGACLIFVEVKQAATHAEAGLRLGSAQRTRIMRAALEYCESSGYGMLPEMRFDAALVNRMGQIDLIEAAFDDSV